MKILTTEQRKEFEEAAKVMMKFLSENCNPHTLVIIDSVDAELLEGCQAFTTSEFIKD